MNYAYIAMELIPYRYDRDRLIKYIVLLYLSNCFDVYGKLFARDGNNGMRLMSIFDTDIIVSNTRSITNEQ